MAPLVTWYTDDSSLKYVYPGTTEYTSDSSLKNAYWSRDGIRPITSRTTGHVMESGQSQASIEPCIHNAPMQGLTSTHTHSTIHLQSWIRSKHTCLILRIIKSATHTGMELPDGHKIKVSFIITICSVTLVCRLKQLTL